MRAKICFTPVYNPELGGHAARGTVGTHSCHNGHVPVSRLACVHCKGKKCKKAMSNRVLHHAPVRHVPFSLLEPGVFVDLEEKDEFEE